MTLPMTLRRCANPKCWRSFPIESCSPKVFCDDDCHWESTLHREVTPPATDAVPPLRARPILDAWAKSRTSR